MDANVIPGFHPSPQAYAPAVEAYGLLLMNTEIPYENADQVAKVTPVHLVSRTP